MSSKMEEMVAQTHVMVEQLYQTILPQMQDRMSKHSQDAQNYALELRTDLKALDKKFSELINVEKENINKVDRRVVKLEAERGMAVKVITPIVSAVTSAVTAWVVGKQ